MGRVRHKLANDGSVIEIHQVIIRKFDVFDLESDHLLKRQGYMLAYEWLHETPEGSFINEHKLSEPEIETFLSPMTFNGQAALIVELEKKKLAEYYMRFGKIDT